MDAFEIWSQGSCRYHCDICITDYDDFSKFRGHIKNDHQIHMLTYIKDHPNYCTVKKTLQCALCSTMIMHDRADLRLHFGKKHPAMKLQDYFTLYVEDSEDVMVVEEEKNVESESQPKWPSMFPSPSSKF